MSSEYINRPGDIPNIGNTDIDIPDLDPNDLPSKDHNIDFNPTEPKQNRQKPQLSDKTLKVVETYLDEVNKVVTLKGKKKNPCPKGRTRCYKAWKMWGDTNFLVLSIYVATNGPQDLKVGGSENPWYDLMLCEWGRRIGLGPC